MSNYISDYAFITELLYGGYTYRGAGKYQCSKKTQKLFLDNEYGKLIEYRNSIYPKNVIDSHWIKAIDNFAAFRYFILCGFHDAQITAVNYDEPSKLLEIELELFNCFYGLALSDSDSKKQNIILIFKGIENRKDILDNFEFDKESYTFIRHNIDAKNKLNLKILIRTYGNYCREFWIDLFCDEIFIVEKH